MTEDTTSSVEQKETKKKDRKYIVYIHTNKINNKAYIGITSKNPKDRWGKDGRNYRRNQPVFYAAIKKYGWDNFEHIIFAENLSKSEAISIEIKLIAIFQTNCKRYKNPELGYNMTDGGEGTLGFVHSDETKQQLSDKAKERYLNPEYNPMYGKHHSDETRKLLSEMRRGTHCGADNYFYGKHHSDESKQKMREYALNRPIEVNQKIGQKAKERLSNPENNHMFGKHIADHVKQIISDTHSIPVVQLTLYGEFINEYKNSNEVEAILGIDSASIRRCCTGNQLSAGGFQWVEKEKYNPLNTYIYINPSLIPVIQLNPDGTFIAEYKSIRDAHKATGVAESGIRRCCKDVCKTSGGFIWIYKAKYDPNNIIARKPRVTKRKIVQCDKDYNYIAEYDGCMHAEKITGHDRHGISDCCEGKKEFYCRYRWMYIEDYEELQKQN